MAWELFTEWADLQFVNYSVSEEFEDGTVGVWKLEDWDIYGPGGGGYSSSGPFGNWEADILAWLNNGSMLARDIIDWDAVELQSHNISDHTQGMVRQHPTTYYINGTSYLPQDPNPTFGLAATAQYTVGDIVVTGARSHSDQSITYRFASYDPITNQPVSWVENVGFLDMARATADANVIRFDLGEGESPFTAQEVVNIEVIRGVVEETLASLRGLDPNGYFDVEGWGRIRVNELVSLLTRADWEIYSSPTFVGGINILGDVNRNDGDPEVRMNRDRMAYLATDVSRLIFHVLHEMGHATRIGWRHRGDANSEVVINDLAAFIMTRIGSPIPSTYTSGSTNIQYH